MNETALSTTIEFVNSPLIPHFLLIQEIGLTLSKVFMFMIYGTMMRMDDESYEEIFSSWALVAIISFFTIVIFLTYTWGMERLLFAFSLSMAIVLSFMRPIFGLCSFIAFLLYRPWELMPDPIVLAIPKYFGLMVIGTFLSRKFRRGEFFLIWNKECTYITLFAVWVLLSVFKTGTFNETLTLYENQFTRLMIIFFLMVNLIKTRLDFLSVQVTFMITIATKGIVSIVNTWLSQPDTTSNIPQAATRLTGIGALADSNDLAAIFIIGLPLLLSVFFKYRDSLSAKFLGVISLTLSSYLIWMTRSRGAIIALLTLFGSYVFSKIKRKSMKILSLLLVAALFFPLTMSFKRSTSDLSESSSNRINYWKTAIIMAARNPLFGVGYNDFPANYEKYAPQLISEFGYRTAHSTWFLVLGETGFIGLLLFLLLYYEIFKKAWRLRHDYPELFYAFIGYSVTMTFLSHAYVIYPYILFALISVAHRIWENSQAEEQT